VRAIAASILLVAMTLAGSAGATLAQDVAELRDAARAKGATVDATKTFFLEEGKIAEIDVPEGVSSFCRTIFFVGARTASLTASSGEASDDADTLLVRLATAGPGGRVESDSGVIRISACGEEARSLSRALVRMGSVRGTVEAVVFGSAGPLDGIDVALGRDAGPLAPRSDPGPPLPAAPLLDRRRRAEERARSLGATNVLPVEMRAGEQGKGELTLKLPAGCHRLDLMAEVREVDGGRVLPLDLDAELRSTDTGEVLGRDRGETPDAHLETCLGKTTELTVVFQGAPPSARVVTLDSIWPLPAGVPSRWGARAQATLASAARRRTSRPPARGPILEVLGAQGTTSVPFSVEPGRCYLAAVALVRGASRGIRISAGADGKASNEEAPAPSDSASVIFCSETTERAHLSVEVPGASLFWVLDVWAMGDRGVASGGSPP
jgi:hypothetical protein